MKSKRLFLVSCVARKQAGPVAAKELYTSTWFKFARQVVEKSSPHWFILSAKHGLVLPDEKICYYNKTLNTMRKIERKEWAECVFAELKPELSNYDQIVFFAGQKYREFLIKDLMDLSTNIRIPMEGLGIGKQLQWLKERLETGFHDNHK